MVINPKPVPTRNTEDDLAFAEQWVTYVSRNHFNAEVRARALIVQATIAMLNVRHPTWRKELLEELNKQGVARPIDKILPLADVDDKTMFRQFIKQVVEGPTTL